MSEYNQLERASGIRGQRVLVTGASGFIGAHLCQRLIECGATVHGISRHPQRTHNMQMAWNTGDVTSIKTVRELFRVVKPDTVYHLASHVMGAPNLEHVLPTFHANLESTVNILTAAAEAGCRRLILTGSLAEPDIRNGELFPSAPYAAAKWASSGYGRMFHALYGVPVVIARVFMVYGPAQRDLSKLIPYTVLSLLQGKAPKISSGKRMVDWINVHDVVDGYIALAEVAGVEGSTVEIGSGELVSIREIVALAADLVDVGIAPCFGELPDRPLEPIRKADILQTYKAIAWKPSISLIEGLKETVGWYREHLGELVEITNR
jgi:UDP-glucose 4-epimerase